MADASLPQSITDELRDLRRRVERLEMSGRLTSSTMTDGTIRIVDANGTTRVVIGKDPTNPADFGVYIANEDGLPVFEVGNTGQVVPRVWNTPAGVLSSIPATGIPQTTSSSFQELLKVTVAAGAPTGSFTFIATLGGGATSAQFEVRAIALGGVSEEVMLGPFTITGASQLGGAITIPTGSALPPGYTSAVGHNFIFRVYGRVSAGAGVAYALPDTCRVP